MEALGHCAENLAHYLAGGVASLFLIGTFFYVAINRTFIGLCFGLVWTAGAWITSVLIFPHLVVFFVVGTIGAGAVACEGFW